MGRSFEGLHSFSATQEEERVGVAQLWILDVNQIFIHTNLFRCWSYIGRQGGRQQLSLERPKVPSSLTLKWMKHRSAKSGWIGYPECWSKYWQETKPNLFSHQSQLKLAEGQLQMFLQPWSSYARGESEQSTDVCIFIVHQLVSWLINVGVFLMTEVDVSLLDLFQIMHSLGFYHEHARSDRDLYIKIVEKNVRPGIVVSCWI